jgi:hypothetical protein
MLERCYNPKQKYYKNYGGRGIKVCARWRKSFENFLEDMGRRPPKMTLNRIDNDGDYTPKNCNWATRKEQMRNSRLARILEYEGEKRSVPEWATKLGLPKRVIHSRLFAGWPVERALGTPYAPRVQVSAEEIAEKNDELKAVEDKIEEAKRILADAKAEEASVNRELRRLKK